MKWYPRDRVKYAVEHALDEVSHQLGDRDLSAPDRTALNQAFLRLKEAKMWVNEIDVDAEEEE